MVTIGELARRHGERRSGHDAYVEIGRRVTWAEFDARSDALGHGLRALGIGPGDRVAMLAADCIEVAELFTACAKIGAVRVGLNVRLAAREIGLLLDDSHPALLFVEAEHEAVAGAALEWVARSPPEIVGFNGGHGMAGDYDDIIARHRGDGALDQTPAEIVQIAYTTGSTGLPKGALYPHRNVLRAMQYMALYEGATRDEVWLHAMPAGGFPIMHMMRNLFHGSTTAIVGRWDDERALTLIEREAATMTVLVPTMISSLLASGLAGKYDMSSLRSLGYGASPLPPATIREAMAVFDCPFLQMYGSTELICIPIMLFPDDHRRGLAERPEILASAGTALSFAETRFVDDDGADVAPGEIGELIVRTGLTTPGFWNAPDKYAEAVRDGWLHTGDLGRIDEEGYIYLVDRKKFRINTGGYMVYPTEVEAVLAEHPAVNEVAVIGLPDPKWGERIHAVVSLMPGAAADEDGLKAHCRGAIADFKVPKGIDIRDELPKGATGKILKRQIIESYLEDSEKG